MSIHIGPSDFAGQTFSIDIPGIGTGDYIVEDFWGRIHPVSWMFADGNPAALKYALRAGMAGLPVDNEVVYGKFNGFGHIVHTTKLTKENA